MCNTKRRRRPERHVRRGSILVLSAVLMVFMMALLAFAIDIGYMYTVRTQLQRSADASAIAGAWELLAEEARLTNGDLSEAITGARDYAGEYAGRNQVGQASPLLGETDVVVGYRQNIFDSSEPVSLLNSSRSNTVSVRVRRTVDQNGVVPLFFAPVLGFDNTSLQAEASAALITSVKGFRIPPGCENLPILPFALDMETANQIKAGGGDATSDHWTHNRETGAVSWGGDRVLEVNLYPQGTGSPGNRGTVDIGSNNNSTADISRQILEGISPQDLAHHGGALQLDADGHLPLNADTGISAGFKDELLSIRGEKRIIPIFDNLTGNGNNATYTIVGWMGVTILDVDLTGPMNQKRLIVQPACLKVKGGVPADADTSPSDFIFSPVVLVE
jgi:Flp pilus assembly protein TadG